MGSTKEQVTTFLAKCEELKKCKFIMATTKIKDLLKCIVNSPDLYRLFEEVTKDFDYVAVRSQCLVSTGDGVLKRNVVVLPHTVGQRLAFIFCLLVDFDRDTINFNDFLRRYFPEDGSYFASYQAFCKCVIDSLAEMLRQVFAEQLEGHGAFRSACADSSEDRLVSAIKKAVEDEIGFIRESSIPADEKESGYKILNELFNAVQTANVSEIEALICGYNYYVLYYKCVSNGIETLIGLLAEFERNL